jgi:hypothetical protein
MYKMLMDGMLVNESSVDGVLVDEVLVDGVLVDGQAHYMDHLSSENHSTSLFVLEILISRL